MSGYARAGRLTGASLTSLRVLIAVLLVGFVATFFFVPSAQAADRTNEIISSVTITRDKAANQPLTSNERLNFSFTWDARSASPALAEGDTIEVELPTWVQFQPTTLEMKSTSPEIVFATCTTKAYVAPTPSTLVCTFNANVADPNYRENLRGGVNNYMYLRTTQTITPTTFNVGPHTFNLTDVATQEVIDKGIVPPVTVRNPNPFPAAADKTSSYTGLQAYTVGDYVVSWAVTVKGTGRDIVITDPIPVPLEPSLYLAKSDSFKNVTHPDTGIVVLHRSISQEQQYAANDPSYVAGSWDSPLMPGETSTDLRAAYRLEKDKFISSYTSAETDLGTQYTAHVTIPNSDPDRWYRVYISTRAVPGTVRVGQSFTNTASVDGVSVNRSQSVLSMADAWAAGDPSKGYIWVHKLLRQADGTGADARLNSERFTFSYTVNGGAVQTGIFTLAEPFLIDNLDAGSKVKIWENEPTDTEYVVWTDAELRDGKVPGINPQPGVTITDSDSAVAHGSSPVATVDVRAGAVIDLNFRNRYIAYGDFKIEKYVGDDSATDAANKEFTIVYTCNAASKDGSYAANTEASVRVKAGQTVSAGKFPVGTICQVLREENADIRGYALNSTLPDPITIRALDYDDQPAARVVNVYQADKVSVGDYVWFDTNKNGQQDAGEEGIDGVALTIGRTDGQAVTDINGAAVTTTQTVTKDGAKGYYIFDNLPILPEGVKYTVTVTTPAGYAPTTSNAAGVAEDVNSNAPTATADELTTDGAHDPKLDFGFIKEKVSVGNYVWWDKNEDGLQDATDEPIAGVELTISRSDNGVVKNAGNVVRADLTETTDNAGTYSFTGLEVLPAGVHYVVTVTGGTDGYFPTTTTTDAALRDKDSSNGSAESTDLTTDGAEDPTLDFGFVKPKVSVGDYVWFDADKDGIQDDNENGLEDVVLTLVGPDGNTVKNVYGDPVVTTKTDADGKYIFENLPVLPAGQSYTVKVTDPFGYISTTAGAGSDRGNDSSTDEASSGDLTTDGAQDLTLDFGYVKARVSVGDYVWFDEDRDGVQDDDEEGLKEVELTISGPDGKTVTDVDGNPVVPVTTDADGKYVFENLPVLPAGQSYVVKVTNPFGYIPTAVASGTERSADSSANEAASNDLTTDGAKDTTLDFGYVKARVSVGDYVWFDADKDGLQDDDEDGLEGVELTLIGPDGQSVTDVDGNTVAPVKTDVDGKYIFENLPVLPAGQSYTVKVSDPFGYVPTTASAGSDRGDDSATAKAVSGDLTTNKAKDLTLDFGYVKARVSVGDYVWSDLNKNGIQDAGEPGIKDVELTLTGPDGQSVTDVDGNPVAPVKTDANGKYTFDNLPVLPEGKSYRVTVNAPKGYTATQAGAGGDRAKDSSTGYADSTDLVNDGDRDDTLDFGFVADPPSKLAKTGANTLVIGGVAVLVLAGGATALFVARKRKKD
ncbi:SdrD B-like domain-containing protein [Schaalia suimastitidis]|uniref:SdrD B-like domain-containing protein n=1 Tax=Schaalia suimastitidis TaxID=121163 RepID=UPI00040FB7F3|nr:SdrD B-like domain-containing protein [Schaalia suimastitidis]